MALYRVLAERTIVETVSVMIEADSEDAAQDAFNDQSAVGFKYEPVELELQACDYEFLSADLD